MLQVRLFGGFHLTHDAQALAIRSSRLQSLVAYLLLHRDLPQSRQELAFLFWPVSNEGQAHTNLRKLIFQLRQTLPHVDDFVHDDQHNLQWRGDAPYRLDVDELEKLIHQNNSPASDIAPLTRIVDLYTGDLLPNCYEDWIVPLRRQYQTQVRQTLEQLITTLEGRRAYEEGMHYAQHLLKLDPLDEISYRHLIRLRSLKGDRTGALRIYHQCVKMLQQELGVEPSPETQQLYSQLLAGKPTLAVAEAPSNHAHHLQPPAAHEHIPLVGRQAEWARLQAAWQQARQPHAHLVIISGEAGIGKSRLAEELANWISQQGGIAAHARSYAAQGALAYAPVVELLRSPALHNRYRDLAPVWQVEVARLLPELLESEPALPAPEPLRESWQRQRFWEALARAVCGDSQHPMLLLLDDLQWCDQETLTWLQYLVQQMARTPLLIVGTVRDDELTPDHPFHTLRLELVRSDQFQQIPLAPLTAGETTLLARQVAPQAISDLEAEHIFQATAGNPLFVVETIRSQLLSAGLIAPGITLQPQTLPPKVHAVIHHRLRQLSAGAQELVGIAATIGRAFSFELLAAVSDEPEEVIADALDELWQRRLVREEGGGYDFSHDRIRDVAYQEIGKNRQRLLHRRVAAALERLAVKDREQVSGLIATHYDRAGLPRQAIPYYRSAAQEAIARYAFADAVKILHAALALIPAVPAGSERNAAELALQMELMDILGYSNGRTDELGQGLQRALELLDPHQDRPLQRRLLAQLSYFYYGRAMYEEAIASGQSQIAQGEALQDPLLVFNGHVALASSYLYQGQLQASMEHYARTTALFDLHQQTWPDEIKRTGFRTTNDARAAQALWFLGYPDQALVLAQQALLKAKENLYPPRITFCLFSLTRLYMLRRQVEPAKLSSERLIAYAQQYKFPQRIAHGIFLRGWARLAEGEAASITEMEAGLAGWLAAGTRKHEPEMLIKIAEGYGALGDVESALARLARAEALIEERNERLAEAELYRVRGEVLKTQPNPPLAQVEMCFHHALVVARRQKAKAWELRAAISLAQLWRQQGQARQAHSLLAGVYNWFTEGFTTPDLVEVQQLLAQLAHAATMES